MHYIILESELKRIALKHALHLEAEHSFHTTRKWRLDYALFNSKYKIAVEVEGGIWKHGRHTRSKGFIADIEKYNEAASMGWVLLRITSPGARGENNEITAIERLIARAVRCRGAKK